MTDPPATLIVGATGMLGRPLARRLVRALLPGACALVRGDVADAGSLAAAMSGLEAVYINLSPPRSPKRYDPEQRGVPAVVEAARKAGVRRLLKISFMGVPGAADAWWQIGRKAESERAVIESGLDYTIFRPTWLMESLALFRVGRRLILPKVPPAPIYWIAGDDYARQVARALQTDHAANRLYTIQGAEPLSLREAARRFGAAWRPGALRILEIPLWALRPLAPIATDVRYVLDLLQVTLETNTRFEARDAWDDLGEPTMSVEDYARYARETGDVPRK
jgi:uncharacterized protein YbjT (DUF2867 family)